MTDFLGTPSRTADDFPGTRRTMSSASLMPSHLRTFPGRSSPPNSDSPWSSGYMSSASSVAGVEYIQSSLSEKYSLSPAPESWGTPFLIGHVEPDDDFHNPAEADVKQRPTMLSSRGFGNLGCLLLLILCILMLFAGYPITSHYTAKKQSTLGGFNLGGINASGQVPELPGNFGLIDRDTPKDAFTKDSYQTGEEMILVFSDEFNQDGRTFYPGDDPYWEAMDFHYWGTNDLEWYDPSQATTKGGYLQLTLEHVDNPSHNHNLDYKSGMIQSWNKFCFTGGLIEASIRLPGDNKVGGLWPAVWTMGNLGRAGYGASLEGTWPYSYDACDVGTLPNQTYPGTMTPTAAVTNGDKYNNDMLSYLPGQRLSACTCPGEAHPGPMRSDGSYVGRSAPEIDIIEATIHNDEGFVSLSAQWAPFNAQYSIYNTSGEVEFFNQSSEYNTYVGGVWQQTTSTLGRTNQRAYELVGGEFAVYGFEYKPGFDDSYITWINDGRKDWTLYSNAMRADPRVEISARPMPQEPMYIIANLGFSENFVANIDYDALTFPTTMSIDYIRVYQPKNAVNVGCDPVDFPTAAYIETFKEAYSNYNHTTWEQYGQPWPKNSRAEGGC